jgi:hypothetical protein
MQENNSIITVEKKKSIHITAVESVVSFSEVKIVLVLQGGERLTVVGTELKIVAFSKTNGSFLADGTVTGVSYGGKGFSAKFFR